MAEELYFPPIGKDVAEGQEYKAENGVTYTWSSVYSSWMIGSSQQVNKDYVDSRDQLRVRVDGFNHMYGDLVIKKTAELGSDIRVKLGLSGVLRLGGNKNIDFLGDGGTVSVSGSEYLRFAGDKFNINKTVRYHESLSSLMKYEGAKENVTIFDVNSNAKIISSIAISKHSNSYFTIRKSGSQYALFRVKSDGGVQCRGTNANRPFSVLPGNIDGSDAFYVLQAGGVYASPTHNRKLIASETSVTKEPDHALVTKGYVDQKSSRPGYGIVALKEEDADINGFWRNGNNLYLRIS